MQKLTACPVCHATKLAPFLSCKDYTVSHETFHLQRCLSCGFVMTNPRPGPEQLPAYYQSEGYISHSNKSTNLVDLIYKAARTFTLKWKLRLLEKYSLQPPTSVLDFGCGTGDFLHHCAKNGLSIEGVEPSPLARKEATTKTGREIKPSVYEISTQSDALTLWHVLEHVADLKHTLEKLRDSLTKNGTMFIAVPNLNSADAEYYGEHWAAYDVPRHLWHFSQNSMGKLLANHDLKITTTVPMHLDAYYVSILSEKYRLGKNTITTMGRAISQGWQSNRRAQRTREYSSLIYIVRK